MANMPTFVLFVPKSAISARRHGGLHAGRFFDLIGNAFVEVAVAVAHDLQGRPARHIRVHILAGLVRGGRADGDRHHRGHADDDAQQRERRPAGPALDLAESEFPENHKAPKPKEQGGRGKEEGRGRCLPSVTGQNAIMTDLVALPSAFRLPPP